MTAKREVHRLSEYLIEGAVWGPPICLITINKILPIAGNSNFSQGPNISGVVSHKMKIKRGPKGIMINLLAQGYKIN